MIERIVAELGPWNWMVLGFILLALEILVPGIFLLWIGLAALAVGVISLGVWGPGAELWTWQIQVLVFLALALLSAYFGKRLMTTRGAETDEPLLNQRSEQLVGRTATLEEPITNGFGRVKIGDTLWRVRGDDAAAGTNVRVVGVVKNDLKVEPI